MRAATCCLVALLAVALMLSTASAYQDELPTFQSVYGQPPVRASGSWAAVGGGYIPLPPDIAVTQTEVLLSGAQNASPQVVRFDRAGNASGVIPLYSWKVGQLDPAEPPTTTGTGETSFPVAVAAAPSGAIYVADYDWAAWTRYAPDGTYLGGWGGREGLQPRFLNPTQICAAPDNSCYVLDVGLSRIKHFSGDGVPLGEFGTPPASADGYSLPMDIAAAGEDGVWLLNATGQWDEATGLWQVDWRVYRYDATGSEVSSWPAASELTAASVGSIDTDSAGNVWVLAGGQLQQFSPNGHVLAQLETTARNFAVSPDDLLWLLVPQMVAPEYSDYVDSESGQYTLETRDFAGNLVQSMGDPQDKEARGTLSGADAFAVTPEGDSYISASNYPADAPIYYTSHFGPDGTLLEVLPFSGVPIYNPVKGAMEFVDFVAEGVGPDGCYYAVNDGAVESGDGHGDPNTWPGHVTIQRSRGDGSAPEVLTVGFPAGIANAEMLPQRPMLAFGADGNFRLLVQGYYLAVEGAHQALVPGPLWVGTVTPRGQVVSEWMTDSPPGLTWAASLLVDPAGDVYIGGIGGVWKYTAAGELIGRIGGYGDEGDNRNATHSRLGSPWFMQLDAQGVLRVLDGQAARVFTFAYPAGPFSDVPWWSWCRDQVQWLVTAGIVTGFPDGSYHPGDQVTRDQMAVYVARADCGGDVNVPSGPARASFSDVSPDDWAYPYVEYCKSAGIVTGYGSEYRPALPVDRAQMAVFLGRRAVGGGWAPSGGPHFTDVPEDYWAYPYIEYCLQTGVAQGYCDGTYRPERVVTRDQMAVFIARAFHTEAGPMP